MSTIPLELSGTGVRTQPNGHRPAPARSPVVSRRRSLPWITVGVLLVVGCGLGFAVTLAHASDRRPVLVVARPVAAGATLTASDLRVADVAADPGVQVLPAAAEASLLGQPAAVPLVPGAVLTAGQVGTAAASPPGQAVLGVAVKAGQYPPQVAAGQHVLLLDTGAQGDSSPAGSVLGSAVVTAVSAATDGSATVVTVQVDESLAAQVAALSAAGHLSLALVGGGER